MNVLFFYFHSLYFPTFSLYSRLSTLLLFVTSRHVKSHMQDKIIPDVLSAMNKDTFDNNTM